MRDVLINQQQAFFISGDDEAFIQLSNGLTASCIKNKIWVIELPAVVVLLGVELA